MPGCQRYTPLAWALQERLRGTPSGLAKLLRLRKNKEQGKQPGRDAVCPAVFTSPSPTLKWPIVETACSLSGLGWAAGQPGFTGPLPANPAAKNWASYLTLQRQHPFPSQGVITTIHVGQKGKKPNHKHMMSGIHTLAANATAKGSSERLQGSSEEFRAAQGCPVEIHRLSASACSLFSPLRYT